MILVLYITYKQKGKQKVKRITVRLPEDTDLVLSEWCKTSKVSKNWAIERAIDLLLESNPAPMRFARPGAVLGAPGEEQD